MVGQEKWLEIEILTSEEASEVVADMLLEEGAIGIATKDPYEIQRIVSEPANMIFAQEDFYASLPSHVSIRAYFSMQENEEEQKHETSQRLRQRLLAMGEFLDLSPCLLSYREVNSKDWAEEWKRYYHANKVTKRLVICPTWESYEAGPNELVLYLDPGSAFGTGEHASTALCLQRIDELSALGQISGPILDLGCGSGILALSLALFGHKDISAMDIDQMATKVAASNFEQNQLSSAIELRTGSISELLVEIEKGEREPFAFLIANIVAEVHEALLDEYKAALKKGGRLILSGIIKHKSKALVEKFEQAGFDLLFQGSDNDWLILDLVFRGNEDSEKVAKLSDNSTNTVRASQASNSSSEEKDFASPNLYLYPIETRQSHSKTPHSRQAHSRRPHSKGPHSRQAKGKNRRLFIISAIILAMFFLILAIVLLLVSGRREASTIRNLEAENKYFSEKLGPSSKFSEKIPKQLFLNLLKLDLEKEENFSLTIAKPLAKGQASWKKGSKARFIQYLQRLLSKYEMFLTDRQEAPRDLYSFRIGNKTSSNLLEIAQGDTTGVYISLQEKTGRSKVYVIKSSSLAENLLNSVKSFFK